MTLSRAIMACTAARSCALCGPSETAGRYVTYRLCV